MRVDKETKQELEELFTEIDIELHETQDPKHWTPHEGDRVQHVEVN